jgi:hypothetical protein
MNFLTLYALNMYTLLFQCCRFSIFFLQDVIRQCQVGRPQVGRGGGRRRPPDLKDST